MKNFEFFSTRHYSRKTGMNKIFAIVFCAICAGRVLGLYAADQETGVIAVAQAPQEAFMRIKSIDGKRYFQMAATTYTLKTGARVTLYAAVHIADPEFYSVMQKAFEKYDAVLMEGIGGNEKYGFEKSGRIPRLSHLFTQTGKEKASLDEIHDLYESMATGLGLKGQMNEMNYREKNFVYPDMNYEELEKHLDAAGVDYLLPEEQFIRPIIPLIQSLVGSGQANQRKSSVMRNIVKNTMAEMILRMDMDVALSGEDEASVKRREYFRVILIERNQKVLDSIKELLAAGKKDIAVFYGAMHLPGIEAGLEKDFGARETGKTWINAWKLF